MHDLLHHNHSIIFTTRDRRCVRGAPGRDGIAPPHPVRAGGDRGGRAGEAEVGLATQAILRPLEFRILHRARGGRRPGRACWPSKRTRKCRSGHFRVPPPLARTGAGGSKGERRGVASGKGVSRAAKPRAFRVGMLAVMEMPAVMETPAARFLLPRSSSASPTRRRARGHRRVVS